MAWVPLLPLLTFSDCKRLKCPDYQYCKEMIILFISSITARDEWDDSDLMPIFDLIGFFFFFGCRWVAFCFENMSLGANFALSFLEVFLVLTTIWSSKSSCSCCHYSSWSFKSLRFISATTSLRDRLLLGTSSIFWLSSWSTELEPSSSLPS